MQVNDVGEFQIIERLAEIIGAEGLSRVENSGRLGFRLRLSIGDDAAAWDGPAGARVLTTDAMVEGVHFDLRRTGWADLGWKSLAVNLSDIAAMGCTPLYSVIALGLRGDLPVDGIEEMYRGMLEACHLNGGEIVGGDVVRSPVFFVSVSMVGVASAGGTGPEVQPLLSRASARHGDKIAVTGSLGCAAGGLRMMLQDLSFDDETSAHLRDAHNRPTPRVAEGSLLALRGVVAAIDISDGLVDDLGKLCDASGVGGVIHSESLPADEFLKATYPEEWVSMVLSGGEDYELLFTAPPQTMAELRTLLDVPLTVIGDVVSEPTGVKVLDQHGAAVEVEGRGWHHFR